MGHASRDRERWINWIVGLAFGCVVAIASFLGGLPGLMLGLVGSVAGFLLLRSVLFLGGASVGIGLTWIVLLIRAQSACDAINQHSADGCRGQGVAPFLVLGLVVLILGVLMTVGARAGVRE